MGTFELSDEERCKLCTLSSNCLIKHVVFVDDIMNDPSSAISVEVVAIVMLWNGARKVTIFRTSMYVGIVEIQEYTSEGAVKLFHYETCNQLQRCEINLNYKFTFPHCVLFLCMRNAFFALDMISIRIFAIHSLRIRMQSSICNTSPFSRVSLRPNIILLSIGPDPFRFVGRTNC